MQWNEWAGIMVLVVVVGFFAKVFFEILTGHDE